MKKLNIPFLLFLVFGSMVLVVGTHFLHGYQMSRNAEGLRTRAEKAEAEGNVDEQIRLLQRYMRYRPDDIDQLKRLLTAARDRTLSAETVDYRELMTQYLALEKAIREYPGDVELRRLGLEFALHRQVMRVKDAMDHLEQIEAISSLNSTDKVTYANCLEAKSKPEEAIALLCELTGYDRATNSFDLEKAADPHEISAYVVLLRILGRQEDREVDLDIASTLMNQMVEQNLEDAEAYLQRATFFQRRFDGKEGKEKSLADVNKAIEINRNEAESSVRVILVAATTLMSVGDLDAAGVLLNDGLEKHPDDRRMYAALADLAQREGNQEGALQILKVGLSKLKLNPDLIYQRAGLELDMGRVADCKEAIDRLRESRFDLFRLKFLEARLLMHEKNFQLAAKNLEQLRSVSGRNESMKRRIDTSLLICYKSLGFNDKIEAIADRVGEKSSTAMAEFAQSLYAQGRYDECLKILNELQKNSGDFNDDGRRFVYKLTLDASIGKEQSKPEAARNWTSVDKMIDVWTKKENYSPRQLEEFNIDMLRRKGKLSEARSRAEAATRRYPQTARFYMLLNSLTTDDQQGMRILDQISQRFGDSASLRAARATRIIQANPEDAIAQLGKLLEGISQFPYREQAALKSVVANSYARINAYDQAIAVMQEMLEANQDNLALRTAIFDLALQAGNDDLMKEVLGDLATRSGKESSEWRIAQASRLLWLYQNDKKEKNVLSQARDLVEKASDDRPDWAPIYELQADIFIEEANFEAAEAALKDALEKRPGNVKTITKLAGVYRNLGRQAEARQLMSQIPDTQKSRGDVMKGLKVLAATDPNAALAKAKSLIPVDSTSGEDLVLLADIYKQAGDEDNALKTLRNAVKVAPEESRTWVRLIDFLTFRERDSEARAVLAELEAKGTGPEKVLALGQAKALLGDYEAAEASYVNALKLNPNDDVLLRNLTLLYQASGQRAKMLATLDRIAAANNVSSKWARRTKASFIAESMSYKDFVAALALLDENANEKGELSGQDLQMWLQLCARRPEASSRQLAADRLTEIQNKRKLKTGEKAILAQVYKTSGRWKDARKTIMDVLAESPDNQAYVTVFVQWLLEEGEFADADRWVRKLSPQSTETLRFKSILLVRNNQSSDAARALLEVSSRAKRPTQADTVSAVALIMEELGQIEPGFYKLAEKQWAKYVKMRPQDSRRLVEYYTRVPQAERLGDALGLCEKEVAKAIKAKDANALKYYMNVALQGLRTNKQYVDSNSEHFDRVSKWFNAAKKYKMDDLHLGWIEIDFHDIRGDFTRLDSMYRDFLTRADVTDLQKAIIRNNLAFQLAVNGRGDEAVEVIGDAIDQLGPRADFLDTRALAYLSSGDSGNAIKDLLLALKSGDGTAPMHFHLALAYAESDKEKAGIELKKALDMGLTEGKVSPAEAKLLTRLKTQLKDYMPQNEPQL